MYHRLTHEGIPSRDILVEPLVGLHHSVVISKLDERKPAVDELPIGVVFRQVEEVVMCRLNREVQHLIRDVQAGALSGINDLNLRVRTIS
jgi:hypothetical protein